MQDLPSLCTIINSRDKVLFLPGIFLLCFEKFRTLGCIKKWPNSKKSLLTPLSTRCKSRRKCHHCFLPVVGLYGRGHYGKRDEPVCWRRIFRGVREGSSGRGWTPGFFLCEGETSPHVCSRMWNPTRNGSQLQLLHHSLYKNGGAASLMTLWM